MRSAAALRGDTPPPSNRTGPLRGRSLARHVVLGAVLGLLVIAGGAGVAGARTRTTRYYTINVAPRTPSSSALFLGLGTTFNPRRFVRLTPYTPGRLDLQWTPAPNEEWPAFDTVRGGWVPPLDFPHGSLSSRHKFVNRANGSCLTIGSRYVNGSAVVESPCSTTGSGVTNEMWLLPVDVLGTRTDEIPFKQGTSAQPKCLDVKDFQDVANASLQGWACQSSGPWNQRFRLALVGVVTCEIGVTNNLCGLRQP
jgi:hypothetical protein